MSLRGILRKYRFRFSLTLGLILLEVALTLLFPIFNGNAIDSTINGNHKGALELGALGIAVLVIGVGRRLFDSRFYSKVYQYIGSEFISKMEDHAPSKKTARLSMTRELVEFLENTMPELIGNIIGLLGVIGIIATLNITIFYGSLLAAVLVFVVYLLTSSKTIRLNKSSNDEFEKQVTIISKNERHELTTHLAQMMKWNIKLSDLEALNFSISWVIMLVFLVSSIVVALNEGITAYGALFALIMYVFQYLENVINLPLFYQNWLRLKEIIGRLQET